MRPGAREVALLRAMASVMASPARQAGVRCDGRRPEARITLDEDAEATLDLNLFTGRLEGDVVDAFSLQPLAGAQVCARQGVVTADATGHFEFSCMGPGVYTGWASAEGHVTQTLAPVTLAADERVAGLRLALTPSVSLDVVVLGSNGALLGGTAPVSLWPVYQNSVHTQQAGGETNSEHGQARFEDIEPARYRVGVRFSRRSSFSNISNEEPCPDFVEVELLPGVTSRIVLRLGGGGAAR